MKSKALKLCIHGQVQGVGYRRWFEQQAIALHLKGYVKNLSSGEVEAVILGLEADVDHMREQCNIGPVHAVVRAVECTEIVVADADFLSFNMLR